jgi:methylated-DNA-[protein]-cysteine S-methyltransferase
MTFFAEKIYALLRKVPKGKVTTYKDLAHAAGSGAYRAVGQVMRCNPDAPATPCHRVVASNGSIGGFFGDTKGEPIQRKIALLKKEGVIVKNNKIVDFEKKRYQFKS